MVEYAYTKLALIKVYYLTGVVHLPSNPSIGFIAVYQKYKKGHL